MFELEITTKITKEFILSKTTQEQIFEFYLGVPVKKGLFCSPSIIREDKTPTCSFYKNKRGVLKYKDFAGPTFDCVGAVMYLYNCSYYIALKTIANDFNLIDLPKLEKHTQKIKFTGNIIETTEKSKIQVEIKEFSTKELDWWNSFGISLKTLKKFKIFSIKSIFLNGYYFNSSSESSPFFGYYGGNNSDGDELWRIYMPTKRKYRFLSNWDSTHFQGIKQLPKDGNHCFIIKSMKDLMVLYEFGLIAIAPTSENVLMSESKYNRISTLFNNNVIVFFDNDLAGVKGAHKYKKSFPSSRIIFIKRKYSKDISDLYKKISRNQFWTVVEELNNIINDRSLKSTKHFYIF